VRAPPRTRTKTRRLTTKTPGRDAGTLPKKKATTETPDRRPGRLRDHGAEKRKNCPQITQIYTDKEKKAISLHVCSGIVFPVLRLRGIRGYVLSVIEFRLVPPALWCFGSPFFPVDCADVYPSRYPGR
jgi:hypothetical protein